SSHAEAGCSAVTPVSERTIGGINVCHQFVEVLTEIEVAALDTYIPGSAPIESGVIPCDVSIHADDDHVVRCHKLRDLRDGIRPLVVVFQGVAITMPVKVVNYRVARGGICIPRREEEAIIPVLSEHFGWMHMVFKRPCLRTCKRSGPE